MSDWKDESDFDINKAVAILWLECDYDFDDVDKTVDLVGYQTYLGAHGMPGERLEKYSEFNPCNNPSDAWPIILEGKISIFNVGLTDKWQAEHPMHDNAKHANPLRAAMIVYLEMNGVKP